MPTATDLKAISPTANAKSNASAKGFNAESHRQQALLQMAELKATLTLLIASTPGGDANLAALNALLANIL